MQTASIAPRAVASPSSRYAAYVLGVLVLVNLLNFVDRNLLAVLMPSIQREFGASDEAMGLVSGPAFMLVHAVLGLPIARWADRGTRRNILALGVALWSAMTAATGFAGSLLAVGVLRMGVGIGEAAGTPPAHSLISDYYAAEKRASALGVYAAGLHLGVAFGFIAAGWLGQELGWRAAFWIVGIPGLVLVPLLALTVREPERTSRALVDPLRDVIGFLARQRSFVLLVVAASFHAMAGYSSAQWAPTYLVRVHGLSYTEVGLALGTVAAFAGGGGALAGGRIVDWLARHDVRWHAWVPALAAFGSIPFACGFLLSETTALALACYAPALFATGLYTAPIHAMKQALARPRMRATAVAIYLFVVSLIGGGAGPWLVGRASDSLRESHGDLGIRFAILGAFTLGSAVAGSLYLLLARSLAADFARGRE